MKKLTLLLCLSAADLSVAMAQNDDPVLTTLFYLVAAFVIIVLLFVAGVAVRLLGVLYKLNHIDQPENVSLWQKLWEKSNDFKGMEQEETLLLDHNYDGIRELDNHLPPWWKGLFYATVVFGVVYYFLYHVSGSLPSSEEEFKTELASFALLAKSAGTKGPAITEENVTITTEAAALADGKQTFMSSCSPCHRPDGGGSIGPNLTDIYWIHGGDLKNIFHTVAKGVLAKGMISWEGQLSPEKIRNVSCYILTLAGTNPPNPKAPQGDKYTAPAPSATPAKTTKAG